MGLTGKVTEQDRTKKKGKISRCDWPELEQTSSQILRRAGITPRSLSSPHLFTRLTPCNPAVGCGAHWMCRHIFRWSERSLRAVEHLPRGERHFFGGVRLFHVVTAVIIFHQRMSPSGDYSPPEGKIGTISSDSLRALISTIVCRAGGKAGKPFCAAEEEEEEERRIISCNTHPWVWSIFF